MWPFCSSGGLDCWIGRSKSHPWKPVAGQAPVAGAVEGGVGPANCLPAAYPEQTGKHDGWVTVRRKHKQKPWCTTNLFMCLTVFPTQRHTRQGSNSGNWWFFSETREDSSNHSQLSSRDQSRWHWRKFKTAGKGKCKFRWLTIDVGSNTQLSQR